MTDARLPARWLTDVVMDSLSDRAWRTFTGSLMWANDAATDGFLPQRSLRFFHPAGVDAATLDELLRLGLWAESDGTDLRIPNWLGMGQEEAAVIEQRKAQNRMRQQAYRDKQAEKLTPKTKAPVTHDVTGDVTRYVGQERDRDRDSDRDRRQALDGAEGETTKTWPAAVPGQPGLMAS